MNFQSNKIKEIFIISISVFLVSCSQSRIENPSFYDEETKFLFKAMNTFCQRTPEQEIKRTTFKYDKNNNLVEKITFYASTPVRKELFVFNSGIQAQADSLYDFRDGKWELSMYVLYKYDKNKLSEKTIYHKEGTAQNRTIYKYVGDYLEWEEHYNYSKKEWELGYGHRLEYDRKGNVSKKERFSNGNKEKVYDTFIYTYKNGQLVTEQRILFTGAIGYEMEYLYNRNGFLDHVVKDGNIVEKNFYKNKKLVEKHTFYYGIDPGFSVCGGNFIYKYEY